MHNAFLGFHIAITTSRHISDATLFLSWEIACPESMVFRTDRAEDQLGARPPRF
jgi:hypothetical protein